MRSKKPSRFRKQPYPILCEICRKAELGYTNNPHLTGHVCGPCHQTVQAIQRIEVVGKERQLIRQAQDRVSTYQAMLGVLTSQVLQQEQNGAQTQDA